MKEALYWQNKGGNVIECSLCPHKCSIKEGEVGVCKVRRNIEGKLYSSSYAQVSSIGLDPIEKKPLLKFFPGSYILSAGTYGCNFKCSFCQNWTVVHAEPRLMKMNPQELVNEAVRLMDEGNIGIAFTYNEPVIWFEYIIEAAKLSKEAGLKNVLVTNGFINQEPLMELLPYIDAMNIDVKAFTEDFYSKICKGKLENVKNTVETAAKACHVEVTTLIIPGLNDSSEEINQLAGWLATINPDIPLHLSRYFPNYEMRNKAPTPLETLERLKAEAEKHLKYVYLGNVWK